MKILIKIVLLIALLSGCFIGWVVLDKALFYHDKISLDEKLFYNEGLRITSPEIIRAANFPHLGVLLGGSLFRYWFQPVNPNWQLVNYGGVEERTVDTYAKLKMVGVELSPEFVVINAGFCQLRTTVHNNHDVTQAVDNIMHNLHLMVDEAKAHNIIPILSTMPPVRPAYLLPYSGLLELPFQKDKIKNNAFQAYNMRIKQLAREKNLFVIDFYEALVDETGQLRKEYALTDGEHLNQNGYRVLGEFFSNQLKSIRNKEQPNIIHTN